MTAPVNHVLVDASIAKSARDPARHPTTMACLRLAQLLQKHECKSGAAMTPALHAEWKRHASRTMVAWLAQMESRGRLRREPDRRVSDLRNAIHLVKDPGIRAELEKDIHLSEAAIFHGFVIFSRDDKQRNFLIELASDYDRASRIQWVNPVSDDDWHDWLLEGCSDTGRHTCGPPQ